MGHWMTLRVPEGFFEEESHVREVIGYESRDQSDVLRAYPKIRRNWIRGIDDEVIAWSPLDWAVTRVMMSHYPRLHMEIHSLWSAPTPRVLEVRVDLHVDVIPHWDSDNTEWGQECIAQELKRICTVLDPICSSLWANSLVPA
jgi:hypothetical protein